MYFMRHTYQTTAAENVSLTVSYQLDDADEDWMEPNLYTHFSCMVATMASYGGLHWIFHRDQNREGIIRDKVC